MTIKQMFYIWDDYPFWSPEDWLTKIKLYILFPVERYVDYFADAQSIDLARTVLRSEGVLAVPTDTVYGIAALAQSSTAIRKLYAIKQRDIHKPVAICVANVDEVYKWAQVSKN